MTLDVDERSLSREGDDTLYEFYVVRMFYCARLTKPKKTKKFGSLYHLNNTTRIFLL